MLVLSRLQDWPERLMALVDDHRNHTFAWGRYDCATFFAEAVERVTGVHVLAAHMPYDSERSAMEKLAASGYRDMEHFATCLFPATAPAQARRGDIGFASRKERLSCPAVVLGAEAVSRDQSGWVVFPVTSLVSAFRVG